jgi:hypothetical protein
VEAGWVASCDPRSDELATRGAPSARQELNEAAGF